MKEAPRVVLFGAGQVGQVILRESVETGYQTTVVDANPLRLEQLKAKYQKIDIVATDLTQPQNIGPLAKLADLVFSALPGPLGYRVLTEVVKNIPEGKSVSDVSFAPEDTSPLNEIAKKRGVTVVEQIGLAPGLPEVVLAHHKREMKVSRLINHATGLSIPKAKGPYYHDPYYHIGDIVELYREADAIRNGQWVKLPPLTEAFRKIFPEFFGADRELVAFYSPGLKFTSGVTRGLLEAADLTLRDTEHFELMTKLRDAGYLNTDSVEIVGKIDGRNIKISIPPVEFTKALFAANWAAPIPGTRNGTLSQIDVGGTLPDGQEVNIQHFLFLESNAPVNSLSIITGSVTFAVGHLALKGELGLTPGIHQPDDVGAAGRYPDIIKHLQTQGIIYQQKKN